MTVYVLLDEYRETSDWGLSSWRIVVQDIKQPELLVQQEASLKQIQELSSQGHSLWLILSAKFASLHQIKFPKMSGKDILPAIRSVVEDDLTQNFDAYHCFYQIQVQGKENRILFGLMDKTFFEYVLYFWQKHGIAVAGITLDWFALNASEVLFLESGDALAHVGELRGWLQKSLVPSRLLNKSKSFQSFCISSHDDMHIHAQPISLSYLIWLVKRLLHTGLFDISMPVKTVKFLDNLSRPQLERLFLKMALGMLGISLLGFSGIFIKNCVYYFENQKKIESYAAHTKVNLEQKLLTYQRQQAQKNQFWKLFIGLQQAVKPGLQLINLNYEAQHLILTVKARDMGVLQKFKQALIRAHLYVKESQVIVENRGISASIEIKAGR